MNQVPPTQDILLSQDSGLDDMSNIHCAVFMCHRINYQLTSSLSRAKTFIKRTKLGHLHE